MSKRKRKLEEGPFLKQHNWISMVSLILVVVLIFSIYDSARGGNSIETGWKDGDVKSYIQHMTLEEKIGQLFIVHVYGKTPTDPDYEETNLNSNRGVKNFEEMIEKYHIGGVIYFNWTDNISSPLDATLVNELSNGIQEIAMNKRIPIPLLISTDQEGGIVARVTEPATVFPGNMALGATRSQEYAKNSAKIMGMELKSLGINTNFAPVIDVNVNPKNPVIGVRSFGEDPNLVSDKGINQMEGYQSENVITTVKHFPGHGDTDVDSHYGLPIIEQDLERLHEVELKPFKAAIDAGVDAIMPGHIVVPALDDSDLPATFSRVILTDLLRGELGFSGLIVTDSLDMAGANVFPPERVAVETFKAGADVLLNPPDVDLAYNAMLEAVRNGEISENRVDQSVSRILEIKMEKGLFQNPYTDPDNISLIGNEEHLRQANEMTNDSITLVKNDNHILPFEKNASLLVTGPSSGRTDLLADLLNEKTVKADSYATDLSPTTEQINIAASRAKDADAVIVTTYTANTNSDQQKLVHSLRETGKPIIVTAVRNPYDIAVFPEIDAYVTTYGDQDISIHSLANVLTGEVNPKGKLPVTIQGLYEYGHGLSY
ncbi:glycoside hydrolase family 3 protein [Jeotgalibacillus marinus]|uniref:beta-N-acetylhexosaminidase n=1 Tax=Jeotgalibacillus marinus TaxID=86667 RepID=A0ABV3Q4H6_9BACL